MLLANAHLLFVYFLLTGEMQEWEDECVESFRAFAGGRVTPKDEWRVRQVCEKKSRLPEEALRLMQSAGESSLLRVFSLV